MSEMLFRDLFYMALDDVSLNCLCFFAKFSLLGERCSFGLPRVLFRKLLSIYVFSYFPSGFEGGIWNLIVSVTDHRLFVYFSFYTSHINTC